MPDSSGSTLHPIVSFWLDVADKVIKLFAVLIAGAWTWMNYRRSRTYAKKLELLLSGSIVVKEHLYVEVVAGLKNLAASRHAVQQQGTGCEILAVMKNMEERRIRLYSVFELHEWIEPGETIDDLIQCKVPIAPKDIVWIRINLRVVSGKIEWNTSCLIKVEETAETTRET
jgi:hypothetical protein